ncbi:hypothetical protein BN946_scf184916.g11 [Trametes cinnabarina]|uniref:Uncharacterized protein n=1 Tax=Pycnoporus cinnabarinus TaxID=5643 RepID=A0A060SLN5_PYCCI|nr:hypothetical protein BN946_scf184916.g11 [Trametes cinnabarina]
MDPNSDPDVMRVWALVSELSEQLSQNRSTSVNLHALTDGVKAQAIHSQTGFVLRRFNLDKPKEVYEAELERMNAAMSAENQTLLNDNRQLSTLIREYEQTLEKTMEKFRIHAHEVQQRELALMRQYERIIVERETEALQATLTENNARSESLVRISRLLRAVLRKLGGEDIQAYEAYLQAQNRAAKTPRQREPSAASLAAGPSQTSENSASEKEAPKEGELCIEDKGKQKEEDEKDDELPPVPDIDRLLDEEEDPEKRVAVAEWSLEREIELARLQRENEELRALLDGLLKPNTPANAPNATATPHLNAPAPGPQEPTHGGSEDGDSEQQPNSTIPRGYRMGGPPGTVGPFGTYKAIPSSRYG